MIWVTNGLSDAQVEHINRHIGNSEEFVTAGGLSAYQGERALEIPEELHIDTSKPLIDEMKKWETFLESLLPVEIRVVTPLEKSWQCSCPSAGHDLHSQACVCPCTYCDSFRHCECAKGDCTCPPICNCSCPHCVHGEPNEISDKRIHDVQLQTAVYQIEDQESSGEVRLCAAPGCETPVPVGNGHGTFCDGCRSAMDWEQFKSSAQDRKRPCATGECNGEAIIGSPWGRFCYNCYLVKNRAWRKAKKARKRAQQQ
jgi:hypothetical protein